MKFAAEIYEKFRDNPENLARALKLHFADEKLPVEAIVGQVEGESIKAEIAELRTTNATLKTAALEHAAALQAKDGEITTLAAALRAERGKVAQLRATCAGPLDIGAANEPPPAQERSRS
jgi:hypothetical protein